MPDFDDRWRHLVQTARRAAADAAPLSADAAAHIAAAGLRTANEPAPLHLDWRSGIAAALVAALLAIVIVDGSAARTFAAAGATLADLPSALPRPPRLPAPAGLPTPATLLAHLPGLGDPSPSPAETIP